MQTITADQMIRLLTVLSEYPKSTMKVLLHVLPSLVDGEYHPASLTSIQNATGIAVKQVIAGMRNLHDDGLLIRQQDSKGTSLYRVSGVLAEILVTKPIVPEYPDTGETASDTTCVFELNQVETDKTDTSLDGVSPSDQLPTSETASGLDVSDHELYIYKTISTNETYKHTKNSSPTESNSVGRTWTQLENSSPTESPDGFLLPINGAHYIPYLSSGDSQEGDSPEKREPWYPGCGRPLSPWVGRSRISDEYSLYAGGVKESDSYRIIQEVAACQTHKDYTALLVKRWRQHFGTAPIRWPMLMKCRKSVGNVALLNAMAAAGKQEIKGDPSPYVMAVAYAEHRNRGAPETAPKQKGKKQTKEE
jgi:hypothetical protein